MPHPEKILGITRDNLEWALGGPLPQGYIRYGDVSRGDVLLKIFDRTELRVRDEVEDDPSFKQIISYAYLIHRPSPDERQCDQVFTYLRGKGGDEARLHAKRSLGVGGHVEESDLARGVMPAVYDDYVAALFREIDEEVEILGSGHAETIQIEGFVNDDSDAVGSVHFGLVHSIKCPRAGVLSCEGKTLVAPAFVGVEILPELRDRFETWSQHVIDAILAERPARA